MRTEATTMSYGYDGLNRLTSAASGGVLTALVAPVMSTALRVFTGRRASMSDATGTWIYGYDVLDRLTSKQNPGLDRGSMSVQWSYDAAGNMTQLTAGESATASQYGYDALNRLQTVTNFRDGIQAKYSYDAVGNLSGLQAYGVVSTSYQYDCYSVGPNYGHRIDESPRTTIWLLTLYT